MSLKLIELQVALPRTQDMGKLQEQMQQRSQVNQSQLGEQTTKELERARRQVAENEKTNHTKLANNGQNNQQSQEQSGKKRKKNASSKEIYSNHPYKGTRLDLEG